MFRMYAVSDSTAAEADPVPSAESKTAPILASPASYLTPEMVEMISKAAPLHDIGKVAVPDHILLKPGKYTDEEFEIIFIWYVNIHRNFMNIFKFICIKQELSPIIITFFLYIFITRYHHKTSDNRCLSR